MQIDGSASVLNDSLRLKPGPESSHVEPLPFQLLAQLSSCYNSIRPS